MEIKFNWILMLRIIVLAVIFGYWFSLYKLVSSAWMAYASAGTISISVTAYAIAGCIIYPVATYAFRKHKKD